MLIRYTQSPGSSIAPAAKISCHRASKFYGPSTLHHVHHNPRPRSLPLQPPLHRRRSLLQQPHPRGDLLIPTKKDLISCLQLNKEGFGVAARGLYMRVPEDIIERLNQAHCAFVGHLFSSI